MIVPNLIILFVLFVLGQIVFGHTGLVFISVDIFTVGRMTWKAYNIHGSENFKATDIILILRFSST